MHDMDTLPDDLLSKVVQCVVRRCVDGSKHDPGTWLGVFANVTMVSKAWRNLAYDMLMEHMGPQGMAIAHATFFYSELTTTRYTAHMMKTKNLEAWLMGEMLCLAKQKWFDDENTPVAPSELSSLLDPAYPSTSYGWGDEVNNLIENYPTPEHVPNGLLHAEHVARTMYRLPKEDYGDHNFASVYSVGPFLRAMRWAASDATQVTIFSMDHRNYFNCLMKAIVIFKSPRRGPVVFHIVHDRV